MVEMSFLRELADAIKEGVETHGAVTLGPTDAEACMKALRFQAGFIPIGTINGRDEPRCTRAVA